MKGLIYLCLAKFLIATTVHFAVYIQPKNCFLSIQYQFMSITLLNVIY